VGSVGEGYLYPSPGGDVITARAVSQTRVIEVPRHAMLYKPLNTYEGVGGSMSRGLGSMQRDILRACEHPMFNGNGLLWFRDAMGNTYTWREVYTVGVLRVEVAKMRGWWCEACPPDTRWLVPHKPHLKWEVVAATFRRVFFSRGPHAHRAWGLSPGDH
jgi:hypothetical protein